MLIHINGTLTISQVHSRIASALGLKRKKPKDTDGQS
jgi:hypothetical protein